MRAALLEARRGLGLTSPNPAVGAVLVIDGKIVTKGHHKRAGFPHAEIECLRGYKKPIPKNAVLYVTLEPCSTVGRTGPCTRAIIEAGVRRLVIGEIDPNPRHAGHGIELLKRAGLNVRAGVLVTECSALNEAFNKWIRTRRPFVIAKCGMSLDGRLSPPPREMKWITSTASRRHAQQLRAQVDAILIGAETLRVDDPRLTVRLRGAKQLAKLRGSFLALHPLARVVDLAQIDPPVGLHEDPIPLPNRNLARVGEVLTAASLENDLDQLVHMVIPVSRGLSRIDHAKPSAMRYWADATA